jgi:hypothetical protein
MKTPNRILIKMERRDEVYSELSITFNNSLPTYFPESPCCCDCVFRLFSVYQCDLKSLVESCAIIADLKAAIGHLVLSVSFRVVTPGAGWGLGRGG